jgi:hypothetical protein
MFIDPAAMPEHLILALIEQSGLERQKALAVARLYESLRAEDPATQTAYGRIVQVDETSGLAIRDKIATAVETVVGFIREFSAAPVDTIDGYRQFEVAFRSYLMAQMGRVVFPLLRALEVNAVGSARIEPTRFTIDVEGGRMEAAALPPEQQRAVRAAWIVAAIRSVDHRGLDGNERVRLDAIAALGTDALTDEIALELEELLLRSTPDNDLWATEEGRDRVALYCLQRTVQETKRLEGIGFPGLEGRDVEFLKSWESDSVMTPDDIATCMRLLAKSAHVEHHQPTVTS